MQINFTHKPSSNLDSDMYIKILVAITKADPSNGEPEKEYVRRQANGLHVNFNRVWSETDKSFEIGQVKVTRQTALTVLRDCIVLASLDDNYSLTERERILTYAQKLRIPLADINSLEKWVSTKKDLEKQWKKILAGELI
ncbi:MAG: hypothetical protein D3926_12860 [Desulfobacteraceae bacterium]|nr:MAG: hypothetical protein D3926_12860 [Desulfobacteraceae bacterium]